MRLATTLRAGILLAQVFSLLDSPLMAQGRSPGPFDLSADLYARHPEIVRDPTFRSWSEGSTLGPWYESERDSLGRQTVVLQDAAGERLYAAITSLTDSLPLRSATQHLVELGVTRSQIASAAVEGIRPALIHALRPVVTFVGPTSLDVHWEIESIDSTGIAVYRFENGRVELQERLQIREANPSGIDPVTPMADDMADNEVHHLTMFRAEASGWIVGATSVQDKVRRVFDRVQQLYRYDATIQHIAEFTWADNLVRDINGRRGICDEWAVVEISYLRSIGIPARLKFLVWRENGNDEAHAALEYSDGGTWRQLDALWNAFNDPGIYRRNGATSVTVMDADDPLDSRSTTPAWGVPDPTGDGKLYPYGDFVLRPDYPGNARPGYSY